MCVCISWLVFGSFFVFFGMEVYFEAICVVLHVLVLYMCTHTAALGTQLHTDTDTYSSPTCVDECIHVHMYMPYAYTYAYICICACVCVCACMYVCVCVDIYVYVHVYIYIYTYIHTYFG